MTEYVLSMFKSRVHSLAQTTKQTKTPHIKGLQKLSGTAPELQTPGSVQRAGAKSAHRGIQSSEYRAWHIESSTTMAMAVISEFRRG